MSDSVSSKTLQEMQLYYQQRAHEYDEWFFCQGRYDHGAEINAQWFAEVDEVFAALDNLQLTGDVLELAPGTGNYTQRLIRTASTLTAIDASTEMIEVNRAKVQNERVSYLLRDLFTWQPERTYDAVFFGFWLSHVPRERLESFWQSVSTMLRPGGKIFFVDSLRESTSTAADQPLPAQDSQLMERKLNDGRAFEIVKNYYTAADLLPFSTQVGITLTIKQTKKYLIYGYGTYSK